MAIEYRLQIAGPQIDHQMILALLGQECPFTAAIPLDNGWQVLESYDSCGFAFYVWNETPTNYWDITDMPQPDEVPLLNGTFVYTQCVDFRMDNLYSWTRSRHKMLKIVSQILDLTSSDVFLKSNDYACFYRRQGVIYINGIYVFGERIRYQKYFENYQVLGKPDRF